MFTILYSKCHFGFVINSLLKIRIVVKIIYGTSLTAESNFMFLIFMSGYQISYFWDGHINFKFLLILSSFNAFVINSCSNS